MLGVLLAIRGSVHRPQLAGSTGAGHDKHMLLPLAPVMGRIPALPLSSKSSQHQQHHVRDISNYRLCCDYPCISVFVGYATPGYRIIFFSASKNIFFSSPLKTDCNKLLLLVDVVILVTMLSTINLK